MFLLMLVYTTELVFEVGVVRKNRDVSMKTKGINWAGPQASL